MNHKKYLSQIGRLGGLSKSPAKLAAVRENGKKGGRPKKIVQAAIAAVAMDWE